MPPPSSWLPASPQQQESWTVSTQGPRSGAFNNVPQEDDDELRVPCDPPYATAADDAPLVQMMPLVFADDEDEESPTSASLSITPPAAAVVTRTRKVSDFLQFVDEDVLDEMTTVNPTSSAAALARAFSFARTLSSFDLGAAEPAEPAAATTTSTLATHNPSALDNEWMNKAFQGDDFASLMVFDDSSLSHPPPPATTLDVTSVDFESLMENVPSFDDLEDLSPVVVVAPDTHPANSKKRGRPSSSKKETAVPPSAPAPKRQRVAEPATPLPESEEMERYLKYRMSNNEASSKSRARRKEREKENAEKVGVLEAQNAELKKELASLRSECGELKSLLEKFLAKQKK